MNDFCVWLCYFSGWFMMAVMVVLGLLYMYLFQSNFAGKSFELTFINLQSVVFLYHACF